MLDKSAAYRAAIVGSPRRIEIQAVVDISDPDMTFSGAESSGAADSQLLRRKPDRDHGPGRSIRGDRGRGHHLAG